MTQDHNAFLLGGNGSKSAKFAAPGDTVEGTVVSTEMRQQTDAKTGAPLTWADGSPKMQLVVALQTTEREDADDDGIRNIYVRGGFKKATLQKAVADAVRAAKADGLEVGGKLAVRHTGTDGDWKLYAAKYTPPTSTFLDEPKEPATAGATKGGGWDTEEPPF